MLRRVYLIANSVGDAVLIEGGLITPNTHLPTQRRTLEAAVRWMIAFGVEPLCEDWEDRLAETEGPHLQHRTWDATPPPSPSGGAP